MADQRFPRDARFRSATASSLTLHRAPQLPATSVGANARGQLCRFQPPRESSCECERSQDASLAQSLHLLNSKEIQDKLTSDSGRAAALAKAGKPLEEQLADIYSVAFSRTPTAEEISSAKSYLDKKVASAEAAKITPEAAKRQAYEDIIWALLNTKEFLFNH